MNQTIYLVIVKAYKHHPSYACFKSKKKAEKYLCNKIIENMDENLDYTAFKSSDLPLDILNYVNIYEADQNLPFIKNEYTKDFDTLDKLYDYFIDMMDFKFYYSIETLPIYD